MKKYLVLFLLVFSMFACFSYADDFVFDNIEYTLNSNQTSPNDIDYYNNTFFVLENPDSGVYVYNKKFVYQTFINASVHDATLVSFKTNGTDYFFADRDAIVYIYNSSYVYTNSFINLTQQDTKIRNIAYDNDNWYVWGSNTDAVYKYYKNWTYTGINYSFNEGSGSLFIDKDYVYKTSFTGINITRYYKNFTKTNISFNIFSDISGNIAGITTDAHSAYILDSSLTDKVKRFSFGEPVIKSSSILSITNKSSDTFQGYCNSTDYNLDILYYEWRWLVDGSITQTSSINRTDTSIIKGLENISILSGIAIYESDINKKIVVNNNGTFYGFEWNGTTHIRNDSFVCGLVDFGTIFVPSLYDNDTKLIISEFTPQFKGYQWNSTCWVENSTLVNGLSITSPRVLPHPDVFEYENELYTMIGDNQGYYYGFVWNGTGWSSNSTIINNLNEIRDEKTNPRYSTPQVFYDKNNQLRMISSDGYFNFESYIYKNGQWENNTAYIQGMDDIGNTAAIKLISVYDAPNPKLLASPNLAANKTIYGYDLSLVPESLDYNLNNYSGTLEKDNELKFSCRASDGFSFSDWFSSEPITVLNDAPNITSTDILPSVIYSNISVTGQCLGFDLNNDTLKYYYKWYVNDTLVSSGLSINYVSNISANVSILDSNNYIKSNNITFSCRAFDGSDNSSWLNSTTKTIQNSAPYVSNINIYPESPELSDDLTYNLTISDVDNDTITLTEIKWYLNNTEQPSLENKTTILSGNVTLNSIWKVSARGFDGVIWSPFINSSQKVIGDTLAPILDNDTLSSLGGVNNAPFTVFVNVTETNNIDFVRVQITDPNLISTNFTMEQVTFGTTSKYKRIYIPNTDGAYTFKFYARDTNFNLRVLNSTLEYKDSTSVSNPSGGGGGGSTTIIETDPGILGSLIIEPYNINLSRPRGSTYRGEIRITNTGILDKNISIQPVPSLDGLVDVKFITNFGNLDSIENVLIPAESAFTTDFILLRYELTLSDIAIIDDVINKQFIITDLSNNEQNKLNFNVQVRQGFFERITGSNSNLNFFTNSIYVLEFCTFDTINEEDCLLRTINFRVWHLLMIIIFIIIIFWIIIRVR